MHKARDLAITLVLRYDDYSALSPTALEAEILEICRKEGVALTVGVVPLAVERQTDPGAQEGRGLPREKIDMLLEAVRRGGVEVALHGLTHQVAAAGQLAEFRGLPAEEQWARLTKGRELLEGPLGTAVRTFIPPWNAYDGATLGALSELGFRSVSARWEDIPEGDTALQVVPSTCELGDVKEAVGQARRLGGGLITALFHPFDFRDGAAGGGYLTIDGFREIVKWIAGQRDLRSCTVDQAAQQDATLTLERCRLWASVRQPESAEQLPPPLNKTWRYLPEERMLRRIQWWQPVAARGYFALLVGVGMGGGYATIRAVPAVPWAAVGAGALAATGVTLLWRRGKFFGWKKTALSIAALSLAVGVALAKILGHPG